jgi:hypothetical protein
MTLEKEKNEDAQSENTKKVYISPTLSEYGSVSKLTKSGGVTNADHGGNMMQPVT